MERRTERRLVKKFDRKKTCLQGSILMIFQETVVIYQQPTRRFKNSFQKNLLRRGYSLASVHDFYRTFWDFRDASKWWLMWRKKVPKTKHFRHVSLAAKDCFSLGGRVSRELCCSIHLSGSVTMRWQRSEPKKRGVTEAPGKKWQMFRCHQNYDDGGGDDGDDHVHDDACGCCYDFGYRHRYGRYGLWVWLWCCWL